MTTQSVQKKQNDAVQTAEARPTRARIPYVDIFENADALLIRAEVPGTDEASTELTVEDNVLSITARAGVPSPGEGYRVLFAEYDTQVVYQRAFELSDAIDTSAITARLRNGVLEVVLGKKEESKPRRISVNAA